MNFQQKVVNDRNSNKLESNDMKMYTTKWLNPCCFEEYNFLIDDEKKRINGKKNT